MKNIDVVLIAYNASKYIRQSLESIFMQSISDDTKVRVIISDDFSSDDTLSIIKQLEPLSPFPFFYVEHDCNLGITRNYQKTFGVCDADYVAVLEGDDYWCSPYHLMNHIMFLEDHRECVMSVNRLIRFEDKDEIFRSVNPNITINKGSYQLITQEDLLQWNHIVNFSSCVYRNSALKQINPKMWDVPVKNVDDWLVSLELSKCGLVGKLHEYQTVYRLHGSNAYGGIGTCNFITDVIHRIEAYDKYFNYEYHVAFEKHIKANKDVLKQLRDNQLYNKLPKSVWLVFVGIRWVIRSLKRLPKYFIPPCIMLKIKSKF